MWYVDKNLAGVWCACHPDGCCDAMPSQDAATAECAHRNATEDAEAAALADLCQNSNPRDGAPDDLC